MSTIGILFTWRNLRLQQNHVRLRMEGKLVKLGHVTLRDARFVISLKYSNGIVK